MEMQGFGFDDWFDQRFKEFNRPAHRPARITAVNRDNYLVRNETGEVLAELSGRMMFSAESGVDFPAVGDWALVQYYNDDTFAIIDGLLPRKSALKRKSAGKKIDYQMIASNIDGAFVMQSCDSNFNLRRLERYLVTIYDGNIEPMLLLSKTDLIDHGELENKINALRGASINCPVIPFSNESREGLTEIKRILAPRKTYCLLGSSGVGKTTLLNHLVGQDAFETSLVREKDGKGRHTTTRRQLIVLENGAMMIDTPGMRELGTIGFTQGIDEGFADILELAQECRFSDCSHTSEAGCAVLHSIREGALSEARYQSYLKLQKESDYHELSYVEKRKKDKKFGQYVKTVKKQIRKKN